MAARSKSHTPAKKATSKKATASKATKASTGKASKAAGSSSRSNAFVNLGRTEAISRVLRSSKRPLSAAEVVERLHDRGRDDAANAVSATLSHLSNRGMVSRNKVILWSVTDPDE